MALTTTPTRRAFQTEALAALGRHGVLTSSQIRSIGTQRLGESRSKGRCRQVLIDAEADGLVRGFHGNRREKSWHLTEAGFDAIAGLVSNPMPMNARKAAGPLRAHLNVVNSFGASLTEAFGMNADVSWSHEEPLAIGGGRYLRPDALLTLMVQEDRSLVGGEWFIEADRGTEAINTLVEKLVAYRTYQQYRPSLPGQRDKGELQWKGRFRAWPPVLFVFDCPRAEHRLNRFAAWARDDPRLLPHWADLPVFAITEVAAGVATELVRIPTRTTHSWFD